MITNNNGKQHSTFSEVFQAIPVVRRYKVVTPRQKFVRDIAALCGSSERAVYSWLRGYHEPPHRAKMLIAKHLRTNVNVLFPL